MSSEKLSKRDRCADKLKALHEKAKAEGRSLSDDEQLSWDTLSAAIEAVDGSRPVQTRRSLPDIPIGRQHSYQDDTEARALRSGESFEQYVRGRNMVADSAEDISMLKVLRGLATGDWRNAEAEQRAISAGSGTGTFLVPTLLSSRLFDKVRALSTVMRAGASTVPIDGDTDVATVVSDPICGWRLENAQVNESDATFGTLTLRPKSLACLSTASVEFLQDSVNGEEAILNTLAKSIAQELDRVCLEGTGIAPEPLGILHSTEVLETVHGADGAPITSWNPLSSGLFTLAENDCAEEKIYSIMSPRTAKAFDQLVDDAGRYMSPPFSYYNAILSAPNRDEGGVINSWGNQLLSSKVSNDVTVGTSDVTSTIYMGDFAESLLLGMRLDPTIQVLSERMADKLQVQFLIHSRFDVAIPYPKNLLRITGITEA